MNRTETKYLVDIQIHIIELHSSEFNLGNAAILTVFSHENKESNLELLLQKTGDDDRNSLDYIVKYGKQQIPIAKFRTDIYHDFKTTDIRVVLSRFHLTVQFAESSSRVQLAEVVPYFNFSTLQLGTKDSKSLIACYEELKVNEALLIEEEALNSIEKKHVVGYSNVVSRCLPLNPCFVIECPQGSTCVEADHYAFCVEIGDSETDKGLQGDSGLGGPRKPTATQILKSLNVDEGWKVAIDVSEITLPEEVLAKNVFFNVTRSGLTSLQHGTILNKNEKTLTIFNFEPARAGNIFYQHNGGENSNDKIVMQILTRTQFNTFKPESFVYIPVSINPINDQPTLYIDWNLKFLVESGSMRELTEKELDIKDSDDSAKDLKLFVMSISQEFSEVSIVRKVQTSGKDFRTESVSSFTYQNMLDREVFVKHESKNAGNQAKSVRIELQVADLKSFGNKTFLHVEIVDVRLHVINERFLTIVADSPLLLTEEALSIAVYPESESLFVNADQGRLKYLEDMITIAVTIPDPSQIDSQKLDHLDNWQSAFEFSQGELRAGKVRVVSRISPDVGSNQNGFLDLRAKYKNQLKFFRMSYMITLQSFDVNLNNYFVFGSDTFSQTITGTDLSAKLFQPHPSHTVPANDIIYTVTRVPEYSYIYLNQSNNSMFQTQETSVLGVGSKFTQSQLNSEKMFLRRKLQALTSVTDQFLFTVEINSLVSNIFSFLVHVTAIRNSNFRFHQNTLSVDEGEQIVLTSSVLSVSCSFSDNFFFYITQYPTHGRLEVVGTRMRKLVAFTYSELKRGVVSYIQDGSESRTDEVKLLLSPITIPTFTSKTGKDYKLPINNISIILNISINLIPDNRPVVVNNKVINITYSDMILITSDILKCHDPDIDQTDANISYTIKPSDPSLKFLNCKSIEQVLNIFTQQDIQDLKICFRQQADTPRSESIIRATSSDPSVKNLADEILITIHIKIVDPFLVAKTSQEIFQIQRAQKLKLDASIIQINSSIYLDPFRTMIAFQKTIYGKIMSNKTVVIQEFSYWDFLKQLISYEHTSNIGDVFETIALTVYAQNFQSTVSFRIRIVEDMKAPSIASLQTFYVIKGKETVLSRNNLKAVKPYENSTLEFLLVELPRNGVFFFKNNFGPNSIFRFSQSDIDRGLVVYKALKNSMNDRVRLNVSNFDRVVGPFDLEIVILPEEMNIETIDVQIGQGKVFRVRDFVSVKKRDYDIIEMSVEMMQYPFHGQLRLQQNASKS